MSSTRRSYTLRLSAEGARQLENDLKKLGREGQASMDRIRRATQPASDGLKSVDRDARRFRTQLQGIGREMPQIARLLGTTALAGGLIAFGRTSLSVARDFQAAMKRVKAATQASAGDLGRLEDKAKAIGGATGFTAMQAAGAIEVLAKNGLSVQAVLGGALDATVALSGALGSELAPTADLVTDLMAQFNLEASQLPMIADRISGAALKSKFGFDDLRGAIGQAGGVAGKFGVDIEEFLTALSLTASGFSSGSDAGTSFKNFLQRLTPQSKDAAAAMRSIGFNAFDAGGNMKSLDEIAQNLREGIAGLSEEARNTSLQKIFGTDAIRTALLLADQGAEGFRELRTAIAEVSAADQAKIRLEGLEGALRELASAWESLQLKAAESGGLDLAEEYVDRLSSAIRYLRDNFAEVEEIVERVAQALTVYLVGRGLRYAIARAIAMRVAYIELAGAVTGVGAAATGTVAALTRLGVAGRVLTSVLGGPVGLALTAASIAALAIDADSASDAIDAAEVASRRATTALDAYREAAGKAAKEQGKLGEKVSESTAKMVAQSRLQLQVALKAQRDTFQALSRNLSGDGLFDGDDISRSIRKLSKAAFDEFYKNGSNGSQPLFNPDTQTFENLGAGFQEIVEALKAFEDGTISVSNLYEKMAKVGGVGEEVQSVVVALDNALVSVNENDLSVAREAMKEMAESLGVFDQELAAVNAAGSEFDLLVAFDKLRTSMLSAAAAGKELHSETYESLFGLLEQASVSEDKIQELETALAATWEEAAAKDEKTYAAQVRDDADEATAALTRMASAHQSISQREEILPGSTDRGAYLRQAQKVAGKGIRDLIGYAEGTDRGRGYNETLDYGAYTGGDVNLINMTLREILDLQKKMLAHPDNPHNSSAVGRYQIVSETLEGLIRNLGLSLDEQFTPKLQDRLADELVRGRAAQGAAGLQQEWQGLKNIPRSTISQALGAQVIPTTDEEVQKKNLAAQELRKKMLEEQADLIDRLVATGDQRAAQLELENTLIGKSEAEAARARYVFEALAEAKRGGIDVDKELTETGETLRQAILRQADAVAELINQQEELKDKTPDALKSFEDTRQMLVSSFEGLRTGAKGLEDVVSDVFDHISKRLWNLALDPVFDVLAGGIEGLFSNLVGRKDGGPVGYADGGAIDIPGFANGGLQVGGRAAGRIRGEGTTRQDNVLLWGSRGEFMQPADAVDYYGMDFMEAVRRRELPRFADGGAIHAVSQRGFSPPSLGVGRDVSGAPSKSEHLDMNVNVAGARGNSEIMEMVEKGITAALRAYDSRALPLRIREINEDPRRVG